MYTQPYVSCFESALDEQAYELSARSNAIEIPVNLSIPGVYDDVSRQVDIHSASITSLARQCVNRSASLLPFLGRPTQCNTDITSLRIHQGTEFVAKDVDHLARLIEGDDKPLNCMLNTFCDIRYCLICPYRLGVLLWLRSRAVHGSSPST